MDRISVNRGGTLIGLTLVLIAVAAWVFAIHQSLAMGGQMAEGSHHLAAMRLGLPAGVSQLPPILVVLLFAGMWAIMIAGMMFPAVAPLASAYQRVYAGRRHSGRGTVPLAVFLVGYLVAWTAFGVAVYLLDRGAEALAVRFAAGGNFLPLVGGAVLVLAGLYQWTPLKAACLRWCRTPLHFVLVDWREGARGAFVMGLHNAVYCVGCCWAMMLTLFVVGVMSLPWMALLAVVIFLEKNSRYAVVAGQVLPIVLVTAGVVLAIHPGALPGITV